MKKLETIIKMIREDKGMTQEDLAEKSDLTRGYISRLESGSYQDGSPSIRTLQKIAHGLAVPLELILNKAGITTADYIQSADTPTYLRAKYDLNNQQIQDVENFINFVKNNLNGR